MPDADLIARARTGDQAAFGELMQLHYELTFRTVLAIVRNEHDARDLCQDIWLKVWQDLPAYRGDAKFTTWLHPIATRRAIDHLRKRRRWFDHFLPFLRNDDSDDRTPAAPEPAAPDDTRDALQQAEAADRYERALAALPPRHRAVLAMRELQGLAYEDIAHALRCPVGTVMSRLYTARRRLAQKLKTDQP
ncbi:MAG: sigma-70 family RNA polymerase sigma factor [Verrucomicrobiota bacterium]